MEVVLVLVSPAVDIVRLHFDLEWPVRVLLLLAILIELSELHQGHGSNVITGRGKLLTQRLSVAVIFHLSDHVGPPVLEEVERGLPVKSKNGEPVCGGHAVSEELDGVTWGTLWNLRRRLHNLGHPHHSMLTSLEDTSVRCIVSGNELDKRDHAS